MNQIGFLTERRGNNMAEKLVQHRHCQSCLKAIPIGEEFCNEECKGKWDDLIKANKKKFWVSIMWMVVVVVFAMLMMSLLSG
jgi:predicted nucleic acid-binding Zn ribbon protein